MSIMNVTFVLIDFKVIVFIKHLKFFMALFPFRYLNLSFGINRKKQFFIQI